MIWQRDFTLASLNAGSANTLVEHLGIEYTAFGDDYDDWKEGKINSSDYRIVFSI